MMSTEKTLGTNRFLWVRRALMVTIVALVGCEAAGDSSGIEPGEDDAGITVWGDTGGDQDTGNWGNRTPGTEDVSLPSKDFCTDNPGSPFCPCESNDDCFSGYCVPSSEGDLLCTKTCEDACPEGWSCKPDPGGAETSYICVQDQINLCRPCQSN